MIEKTNGYLIGKIVRARKNQSGMDRSEAESYFTAFRSLEEHFFEKEHVFTDTGLAMAENVSNCGEVGGENDRRFTIMTTHGPRHVADLITNLDKLARNIDQKGNSNMGRLDIHEAYILLCSAHLHDVGNIGGRKNHPDEIRDKIASNKTRIAGTFSAQQIFEVASAHGGEDEEFGKDKIRRIRTGKGTGPRLQLLAAMLRLADELAENPERVPEAILERLKAVPESLLAFAYARCFQDFHIEGETLQINFRVCPSQRNLTTEVEGDTVTFFKFLETRIDKMEKEAKYCSQYGRPELNIAEIKIAIFFHEDEIPSKVERTANLTLELEQGYPEELRPLSERCPELRGASSLDDYCKKLLY